MGEFNNALGNEAGPTPLTLRAGTLEEKTWYLSRPDQNTKGQYETWMEERAYRTVEKSRKYLSSTSYLMSLDHLNNAIEDEGLKWGSDRWLQKVLSRGGMTLLLWLMLKPNHPGITQEEVDKISDQALLEDPPIKSTDPNIPSHEGKLIALVLRLSLAKKDDPLEEKTTAPLATA